LPFLPSRVCHPFLSCKSSQSCHPAFHCFYHLLNPLLRANGVATLPLPQGLEAPPTGSSAASGTGGRRSAKMNSASASACTRLPATTCHPFICSTLINSCNSWTTLFFRFSVSLCLRRFRRAPLRVTPLALCPLFMQFVDKKQPGHYIRAGVGLQDPRPDPGSPVPE